MPYLSRIRVNPLRAESQKLLARPRAMHGAVQAGFPGVQGAERVLWRLDADDPYRPHLFVLSASRPDWSHLVEQAGWPDADGDHYAVRDYQPLLDRLTADSEFAFRLTANPVQNTAHPQKPTARQTEQTGTGLTRGLRIGHRTAAAQLGWFLKRTDRWGFDVPDAPGVAENRDFQDRPPKDVRVTGRRRRSFDKGRRGTRQDQVVISQATFEGRLRVTDPDVFAQKLLAGFGPSKAYGCGLLTLAPLEK